MNVLVVDVGGHSVKMLATGQEKPRSFPSGPSLTAALMVAGVKESADGWTYDVLAIGYPGPVLHGRPTGRPRSQSMSRNAEGKHACGPQTVLSCARVIFRSKAESCTNFRRAPRPRSSRHRRRGLLGQMARKYQ